MVFLDASPVIYYIEQPPVWGPRAKARLTGLITAGEQFAVTDLVRMECLVGPFKKRDVKAENDFQAFFRSPQVRVLSIDSAVGERAARIRALQGFKPLDSLHLAAAVVHGCTFFLTNDGRLNAFTDIAIEVLS